MGTGIAHGGSSAFAGLIRVQLHDLTMERVEAAPRADYSWAIMGRQVGPPAGKISGTGSRDKALSRIEYARNSLKSFSDGRLG